METSAVLNTSETATVDDGSTGTKLGAGDARCDVAATDASRAHRGA